MGARGQKNVEIKVTVVTMPSLPSLIKYQELIRRLREVH